MIGTLAVHIAAHVGALLKLLAIMGFPWIRQRQAEAGVPEIFEKGDFTAFTWTTPDGPHTVVVGVDFVVETLPSGERFTWMAPADELADVDDRRPVNAWPPAVAEALDCLVG